MESGVDALRIVVWVALGFVVLGALAVPVAHAAPTGVCGEGGGLWDTVDTACVYGDGICVWYSPYTPFIICT